MTAPNTPPTTPLPTPPVVPPAVPTIPPSAPITTTGGGDTPPVATEPAGTEATPPVVDEWANFDAERAKQTILNQRKSEKDLRDQLAAERAKNEAHEREKLTEAERIKADLDAANARLAERDRLDAERDARQAFDTAAQTAGVLPNALTAARTIAAEVGATDESGSMVIDDALFAALKADHGYLFATPTQQAAPPRVTFGAASSQGLGSPTSLTPEQVAFAQKAGMSPEDFAKHSVRAH